MANLFIKQWNKFKHLVWIHATLREWDDCKVDNEETTCLHN